MYIIAYNQLYSNYIYIVIIYIFIIIIIVVVVDVMLCYIILYTVSNHCKRRNENTAAQIPLFSATSVGVSAGPDSSGSPQQPDEAHWWPFHGEKILWKCGNI